MPNSYIKLKAFTLVEMLVALAVGSIMIMATYASYDVVSQQFKKNKDIAELHTSGRAIMRMVERDISMAGFAFRDRDANVIFGKILDKDALKLTDSGTDECCDSVTVQYDYYDEEYKTVERQEIIYSTSKYKDRHRLYKQINILGKDGELYTLKKIRKKEVMADFIEDFQLVNVENNTDLYLIGTGSGSRSIKVIDTATKTVKSSIATGASLHYPDMAIKTKKSGQEALVKIHLVIRSRKEHSKIDKTYAKKSYDIGNYKLNKRDKYKHDSFSSTVLVRNMVL